MKKKRFLAFLLSFALMMPTVSVSAEEYEPTQAEISVEDVLKDEPVIDEPVIDEPAIDEPVIDEPVIDEPVVSEPAADIPLQNDTTPTEEETSHELTLFDIYGDPDDLGDIVASGSCGTNLTWTLTDDGTLTISGEGAMYNWTTTTYEEIPWYNYRSDLKTIVMGSRVTSIGDWAFYNCYRLTAVSIPDSVSSIGDHAFDWCSSLTGITIPDSVTSIGERAFDWCSSLTEVTIPNSVTSIGDYAFVGCENLIKITIPGSITSIRKSVFLQCKNLTTVTISEGVTSIGENAFKYCESLTEVTIPKSVTSIGESAFSSCNNLTKITIPDSVTSIGKSAFYHCTSLTKMVIPNSVTNIGEQAFNYCISLAEVTIPNRLTSIEKQVFWQCKSLTKIAIPNSVTSIGEETFGHCTNLTEITIPDSVTSIGNYALSCCTSLTEITIPDNVTSIGDRTFLKCTNLAKITIPVSVTNIGESAFYNCTSLTDVYYSGTEAEWNAVFINEGNESLTGANIHFKVPCEKDHAEVIDTGYDATCTETGLTEGKHCNICGEVLVAQTVLPAKGHTFTETFQWADDLSSATAVLTCHCGHSEEQPCELTWDNSQSSRLIVTATLKMNEQTFSESKEISAVKEGNNITLTFDAVYSGLKISAAAYNNNGQMTAYKTPETIGKAVTLAISGDQIRIFFMTEKYCPISSFLQF